MTNRDIVVIGGSKGSHSALQQILPKLKPDLRASVFVVRHLPHDRTSHLAGSLKKFCPLPIVTAKDGMPIEPGKVCVVAPNHHLIILPTGIRLGTGPKENMARPAIDPTFRSAAYSFGPRVIGVLLSGLMSDGAAGLLDIGRRGGRTIVQDPSDAEEHEIPDSALHVLKPDQVLPADLIAGRINDFSNELVEPVEPGDTDLQIEVEIAAGGRIGSRIVADIAQPSALTCPTCKGVLSEISTRTPLRYRCQVGHAFAATDLIDRQQKALEEGLYVSMRLLEERASLVSRMAVDARRRGQTATATMYEERAKEYDEYANSIRQAIKASIELESRIAQRQ